MNWWKNGKYPLKTGKSNFLKILDFYLFRSPVQFHNGKKVSVRGFTFEERKITHSKLTDLFRAIQRSFPKDEFIVLKGKNIEQVEEIVKKKLNNNSWQDLNFEFAVFKKNNQLGETKSLFYMIRNAFAHGSFSVESINTKKKVYYLETEHNKEKKGILRLNESTLLHWIDLIEKYTK